MHCGFCTAICPIDPLLGDELDPPRGRIDLIEDMLEGGKPASAEPARRRSQIGLDIRAIESSSRAASAMVSAACTRPFI